MTQDALPVESNLDHEAVDKFFETGGEMPVEAPLEPSQDDEGGEATHQEPPEEKESREAEIDRNLKAALSEERNLRKEIQRDKQILLEKTQKMEEAFQRFVDAQTPAYRAPSFDEDPLAALHHKTQQHEQAVQQLYQNEYQKQQQAEFQSRRDAFINQYAESARQFSKNNPDFSEAYQFLVGSQINEHKIAGYTDEQAKQLLIDDELGIAATAFQAGVNPAERIYALAKARGYTPKQGGNKLEQVAKVVQAGKSLSNASGKSSKGFSLESLANLDREEFDEVVKTQWDKITRSMQ
jgi:hypothetical protein